MFVVLVWWKIKPGWDKDFVKEWQDKLKIEDKSGLVAEFLTKVDPPDSDNTWDLRVSESSTYVNVGIWRSKKDFDLQIGKYKMRMRDVERKFRVRALLTPVTWRLGNADLKTVASKDGLVE